MSKRILNLYIDTFIADKVMERYPKQASQLVEDYFRTILEGKDSEQVKVFDKSKEIEELTKKLDMAKAEKGILEKEALGISEKIEQTEVVEDEDDAD